MTKTTVTQRLYASLEKCVAHADSLLQLSTAPGVIPGPKLKKLQGDIAEAKALLGSVDPSAAAPKPKKKAKKPEAPASTPVNDVLETMGDLLEGVGPLLRQLGKLTGGK